MKADGRRSAFLAVELNLVDEFGRRLKGWLYLLMGFMLTGLVLLLLLRSPRADMGGTPAGATLAFLIPSYG